MPAEYRRVVAFDSILFKNDKDTPPEHTMRAGTVVSERTDNLGRELVDIQFDHRPETVSHGHFASGVKDIKVSPYKSGCHCRICRPSRKDNAR